MVSDESAPIDLELLKKAIDASNDGIVIAEREGDDNILIYANKAFEQLSGYQQDEILFQDCRFLQAGDRDQEGLTKIKVALENNEACRVVLRNYRKDGSQFWNELSISPVFNDQDQLMYYIGVQKDVTRQVEAEARAQAAEEELEKLRRQLSNA
ncbi:PAS domain-containing protein [Bacterioplanoides sp. SCSIO 12839]|uniref:PAS domain-containing protein n=1 Tax=Bacterioplanoides sp. SCSIO 12839 TaxID=2829569 RepID=UPI0021059B0B|nr:PAS domain-containing protein [Bacterioplanoides sp. SCSIO 12839]UTW47506.1 PAS domain-containing protein [Bacterioplanoides sp. SCSIO 12839]